MFGWRLQAKGLSIVRVLTRVHRSTGSQTAHRLLPLRPHQPASAELGTQSMEKQEQYLYVDYCKGAE